MLQVTFPLEYPDSVPEFAYCQGTNIDINLSDSLMKVLKTSANQRTKNGRPCLEFCLRALVTAFKKVWQIDLDVRSGQLKFHLIFLGYKYW